MRPLLAVVCLVSALSTTSCSCSGKAEAEASRVPSNAAAKTRPVPVIDHEHQELARCVADAYLASGSIEPVDGVASVDRTGLTPRYSVDPALPGLLTCIEREGAIEKGSSTFRATMTDEGAVKVGQVPKLVSGELWEKTPWWGTQFSICVLKQKGLRAPQEGAILAEVRLDERGAVTDVRRIAVTIQEEDSLIPCIEAEFADVDELEPVKGPVVINYRGHIRVGDRD